MSFHGQRLLILFTLLATGCASLRGGPTARQFVFEKQWVRATTKGEFLPFRRLNRATPVVIENMVVDANAIDGVVAYNRKSGSQVWRLDLVNGVEGGIAEDGGVLYFGSSNGQFYAVEALSGRVLWTFQVRAETLALPLVRDGVVYFLSGADVAFALDAKTGKQLWIYNRQTTSNFSIRAGGRPTVDGDMVFLGFSDGFMVALRKKDGSMIWERKLGRNSRFRDVDTTAVVDDKNLFAASFDGALYCLDKAGGEVQWQVEEGGYLPVTLDGEHLFYSSINGNLMSLNKQTGQAEWSTKVARGIATQPVLHKGYLLYGESEGALLAVDSRNGNQVAYFEPGRGLVAAPLITEQGEVYMMSNNANLWALRMQLRKPADLLPWQK